MTSVSPTTAAPRDEQAGVRLVLKPEDAAPSGYVDGGWWPRSRDLGAELPALLDALAARTGQVERVSYRLQDWDATTGRVAAGGADVHLDGFRLRAANTLDVVTRSHRLTLLVVPADTDPETADRALRTAGQPGNTDDAPALLSAPANP
jgi:hypothetical protein